MPAQARSRRREFSKGSYLVSVRPDRRSWMARVRSPCWRHATDRRKGAADEPHRVGGVLAAPPVEGRRREALHSRELPQRHPAFDCAVISRRHFASAVFVTPRLVAAARTHEPRPNGPTEHSHAYNMLHDPVPSHLQFRPRRGRSLPPQHPQLGRLLPASSTPWSSYSA